MGWNTPRTYIAGEVHAAATLNTDHRDNLIALYGASMLSVAPAADDDLFATSATTIGAGGRAARQGFAGLVIGTHPDNDVASDKVMLRALDEVHMSNGTRYRHLSLPLVADITGSGAGGLDTGARTAAKWYELWLIGKSSTKAAADLRLVFHRAKEHVLDQSFTTSPDAFRALRVSTATATDKLSQGFTASASGLLEFIDVRPALQGALTGNVWFTVEANNAGAPSGTPLATSDKFNGAELSTFTGGALRVPFRAPAAVVNGTQYHWVMHGDYTRSDTVFVYLQGVAAGGYAGGSAQQYNGSAWSAATGVGDFWFKAYVTAPSAALTYPSGYDEGCKLTYVYNSSGNVLVPFRATDRLVRFLTRDYPAQPTSTNYFTLVDLFAGYAPPCPCLMEFSLGCSGTMSAFIGGVPLGFRMTTTPVSRLALDNSTGGAPGYPTQPIPTEYQGMYFLVTDTLTPYVTGYEWLS